MPEDGHDGKKTLGGFELISLLGRGGMGAVYKARQASLDRLVALKVLAPSLARNRDFIMRFLREARAAGRLNHPNIVTGIDVGEADNYFYFAMEYVDGESLGKRLGREGNIAPKEAVALVRQVAEGLRHAHEHGLIHRDVKPENVLVDSRGTAKLCDLGLARATGPDDSSLTQTGTALGTPNYISPEQARGEGDVDARTDIYSLGASLFHLIAGRPPYEGKTSAVVLSKHLKDPVPQLVRAVPSAGHNISAVVAKCMQKSPGDRYGSVAELTEDLDLVLAGRPPKAVGLRTLGQRTRARAAAGTGATQATSPLAPVSRRARAAGSTSIFEAARSRPWSLVVAGTVLMVISAAAAWAFARPGSGPGEGGEDAPRRPERLPDRPPVTPAGPDHAKMVADARAFWAAHPRSFETALDRARRVSTAARGTKWWVDADKLLQEITAARKKAADAALADVKGRAAGAAAAGDYDGAIAAWGKVPPELAAVLGGRADAARVELRRAAETKLGDVLGKAAGELAAGRPEEGLKQLAAADGIKYAAWANRIGALRADLEKARDDATARARLAKLAAARKKLEGYLDAFDAKGAAGDFAAARAEAKRAAADPELKELAADLAALTGVADSLGRAAAARRTVLLEIKRGGRQTLLTPEGWVSGTVEKIGDDTITVTWTSKVGNTEKLRSKEIRIADIGGEVGERLRGAFRPVSPADQLAEAIRACAAGEAAAMDAAMKAAAGHPLQPRWGARLDVLRPPCASGPSRS
ncbi:MAG: serine/threonine-protein kinase [Planctomycetota bacterium]|jgi:serine/threonine-protein kinase